MFLQRNIGTALRVALLTVVALTTMGAEDCAETTQEIMDEAATVVATLLTPTPHPGQEVISADDSFLYVASGDSVPYGADMPRRYPYGAVLFDDHLRPTYESSATWTNIAVSGQTPIDYIKNQLPRIIELQPDLVTVTIGANDILARLQDGATAVGQDPQCGLDEQLTRENLNVILFAIVERTEALVAITTYYNPLTGTSGDIAQGCLDVLNGFIESASEAVNKRFPDRVVLVDIGDAFRGHEWVIGGASDETYVEDCGGVICVHPNLAGQAKIAQVIWDAIAGRLEGQQ